MFVLLCLFVPVIFVEIKFTSDTEDWHGLERLPRWWGGAVALPEQWWWSRSARRSRSTTTATATATATISKWWQWYQQDSTPTITTMSGTCSSTAPKPTIIVINVTTSLVMCSGPIIKTKLLTWSSSDGSRTPQSSTYPTMWPRQGVPTMFSGWGRTPGARRPGKGDFKATISRPPLMAEILGCFWPWNWPDKKSGFACFWPRNEPRRQNVWLLTFVIPGGILSQAQHQPGLKSNRWLCDALCVWQVIDETNAQTWQRHTYVRTFKP